MEDFNFTPRRKRVVHYDEFEANRSILSRAEQWLESGPLATLLEGGIPPGIGTDDGRLMHQISNLQAEGSCLGRVILLYTSDRNLRRTAKAMLARKHWDRDEHVVVIAINQKLYIEACVESQLEFQRGQEISSGPVFYNFLRRSVVSMPRNFSNAIVLSLPIPIRKNVLFHSLYDIPNISRGLPNISFRGGRVIIKEGGFLRRNTLKDSEEYQWSEMPMEDIWALPDFEIGLNREFCAFSQRTELYDRVVLNFGSNIGSRVETGMWLRDSRNQF
jgi:hypothetical protein